MKDIAKKIKAGAGVGIVEIGGDHFALVHLPNINEGLGGSGKVEQLVKIHHFGK